MLASAFRQMLLTLLHTLQAREADQQFEVTCSYCEIYNEVIYDLLAPTSGPLDLR